MTYKAALRVWRGDDGKGQLADYTVEVNDGEVVLDVLHRLQATQAGDLAIRWNCKAGKCGSCSMEINGRPRLACMTRMSVYAEDETLTITPLRTFPVIRDLVTDVSFNYAKAREIPSFTPDPSIGLGEFRMQQVDVQRSQEFRKCIECYLCQNTCHVIRDHPENEREFAGPRFLMRIAELEMHPADEADRREIAQDDFGLGLCNITKCCTEVCPENIKITDNALIPMKERVVGRKYDPLTWLGSKIGRRPHHDTPRRPGGQGKLKPLNSPQRKPSRAGPPARDDSCPPRKSGRGAAGPVPGHRVQGEAGVLGRSAPGLAVPVQQHGVLWPGLAVQAALRHFVHPHVARAERRDASR